VQRLRRQPLPENQISRAPLSSEQSLKIAIIGTGFAGYGALVALQRAKTEEVHVFDVGLTERYPGQADRPVANAKKHKDSFFTYGINDQRWSVRLGSERICSSHAFGGHSTVYSGAVLYPKDTDLDEWPEESRPRAADYAAILEGMEIMHGEDELCRQFPPFPEDADLSSLENSSSTAVLGLSRIALQKEKYPGDRSPRLFRADTLFHKLRSSGKLTYHGDIYVTRILPVGSRLALQCEREDGQVKTFGDFDAVFVGAGCVNTTGIVDRSLFGEGSRDYQLRSVGVLINAFIRLPAAKSEPHSDRWKWSLPEFFLEVKSPLTSHTWMHTQITAINEQIIDAINSKIPFFGALLGKMMRRFIYFSLTTFHSRHSSGIGIRCISEATGGGAEMTHAIAVREVPDRGKPREFLAALRDGVGEKWSTLRMVPFPFAGILADFFRGNKLGSWHFGGTLPMKSNPDRAHCRPNGEVCGLEKVYIIDSSAFPQIPGSTVALLSAAHAYRVARTWMEKTGSR